MELLEQDQLKRFQNVDIFGDNHRADFAPTSIAIEQFDQLKTVIAGLESAQDEQSGSGGGSKGATKGKTVLINELWRDIGRITETAPRMKSLSAVEKGYFHRPERREEAIIGAARTFILKATPLWDKFQAYELPADLLTEMQADLDDYDANFAAQQGDRQVRIGSGKEIEKLIDEGTEILEDLRPIVNNKFHGNEAVLTAWKSAVRYPPRKKTVASPTS